MNVKFGTFYFSLGLLLFHVMLATVHKEWGGFLPNSSKRCIECQSRLFFFCI